MDDDVIYDENGVPVGVEEGCAIITLNAKQQAPACKVG